MVHISTFVLAQIAFESSTCTTVLVRLFLIICDKSLATFWACEWELQQTEHSNDLIPLWVFSWLDKLPLCVNDFAHTLHANGFSPVCTRMCLVSFDLNDATYSHKWHWCFCWLFTAAFFEALTLVCFFRSLGFLAFTFCLFFSPFFGSGLGLLAFPPSFI